MGTWDSSRKIIEVTIEDYTKVKRTTHEEMPQGVNEEAYLNRRLREETDKNEGAYNVGVSYNGQEFSTRS